MSGQHARLSGSSAERFMNCAGSVALAEIMPPEEDDEYNAEGTAAHELGETALREGKDAYHYLGRAFYNHVVDADMIKHVQVYLDFVRDELGECEMMIEERIEDDDLGPDFGGQVDAAGYNLPDWIKVIDLKYGIGIPVEVENNSQMWYYAFGILRKLEVQRGDDIPVHISIVQPRAIHFQGPIRTQIISSDAILAWGEDELIPAMAAVDAEETPFDWGEHCRFCPAKLICPRMIENYEEMAATDIEDIPNFDDATLADRYRKIRTLKYYVKALKAEAERRAKDSAPLPGTKMVYGKGSRVWKTEAEVELVNEFGEEAYTESVLKSPAMIEALPGGKQMTGRWAHKQKGKPTLVDEHESGEPYDPSKEGEGFAAIPSDPKTSE